jgi:hypothetical protein
VSSGDDPKYFGQPMHDLGAAHPGDVDTLIEEVLADRAEAWRALAEM